MIDPLGFQTTSKDQNQCWEDCAKTRYYLKRLRDVRTLLNGLAAHLKAKLVIKPGGHPGAGKIVRRLHDSPGQPPGFRLRWR